MIDFRSTRETRASSFQAQSPKMNYKASFQPYETLVDGQWQPSDSIEMQARHT